MLIYFPLTRVWLSELSEHILTLKPYLEGQAFQPGMGVVERMKTALKYTTELMRAELVANSLTEANRKIAFSLQQFMVRSCYPLLYRYRFLTLWDS